MGGASTPARQQPARPRPKTTSCSHTLQPNPEAAASAPPAERPPPHAPNAACCAAFGVLHSHWRGVIVRGTVQAQENTIYCGFFLTNTSYSVIFASAAAIPRMPAGCFPACMAAGAGQALAQDFWLGLRAGIPEESGLGTAARVCFCRRFAERSAPHFRLFVVSFVVPARPLLPIGSSRLPPGHSHRAGRCVPAQSGSRCSPSAACSCKLGTT